MRSQKHRPGRDRGKSVAHLGSAVAAGRPTPLKEMLAVGYEWTRLHAAIAVWDIAGGAEAGSVIRTLLEVWEENEATAHRIVTFLAPAATGLTTGEAAVVGPTAPVPPDLRIRQRQLVTRQLAGL
ncbi:hypothetical protein OG709_01280 [Streptomyces sp. NBC_01267]|uniref:hypothetical protein n=1 Tax=Streptomyces sp. NBC_01267 TaxID=2903805 RepID=UPI002E37B14D|nr:hypothetical protein [Streptomyces sp. NBC_01267]